MNFKEHLSEGTLQQLLTNELPEGQKSAAGLHLSYCPVCREQRDELALRLAAQRMWEVHERSGIPGEPHVDNTDFRRFWLGELRDEQRVRQISRHCIACLDCRRKREHVRSELEGARALTLTGLITAAYRGVVRRRRIIGGVVGGVLISLGAFWLLHKLLAEHRAPNNTTSNMVTSVSTNSNSNAPVPSPTPPQDQPLKNPRRAVTVPRRHAEPPPVAGQDLLAQAQTIDLTRAPDGAVSRSPEEGDTGEMADFKIVASRSGPTRLKISLPPNSKKGVYYVSLRDQSHLDEIVPAQGRSSDGVSLPVSLNIQNLSEDKYVLRIERPTTESGHPEYIGDFEVVVTNPTSESSRPDQATPASEK